VSTSGKSQDGFARSGGGDRSIPAQAAQFSLLLSGEEVLPRDDITGAAALVGGTCFFTYFTARKTESITVVQTETDATAGATLTIARVGIYTAIGGTLTLVASSTNDTAMWNATNTVYAKALTATWNKVAGQRYALCLLAVGTTMPTLSAIGVRPLSAALAPRIQGQLAAQANLPGSTPESGLAAGTNRFQGIFLP
jgi:hypothetical protein